MAARERLRRYVTPEEDRAAENQEPHDAQRSARVERALRPCKRRSARRVPSRQARERVDRRAAGLPARRGPQLEVQVAADRIAVSPTKPIGCMRRRRRRRRARGARGTRSRPRSRRRRPSRARRCRPSQWRGRGSRCGTSPRRRLAVQPPPPPRWGVTRAGRRRTAKPARRCRGGSRPSRRPVRGSRTTPAASATLERSGEATKGTVRAPAPRWPAGPGKRRRTGVRMRAGTGPRGRLSAYGVS